SMGRDASAMSDDDIRQRVAERERRFREEAPTSAAEAATIILNGVKADQWRILVGPDAHKIDELVRRSPEHAYDVDFFEQLAREVGWRSCCQPIRRSGRIRGDPDGCDRTQAGG